MPSGEKICIISRLSILYLPNLSGPTTTPQHSLILNSRVLNPYGFPKPLLQYFGIDPFHFYKNLTLLSKFLHNCFSLLFSQQGEHVDFVAHHTSLRVICPSWLIGIILHKRWVHPQGLQCVSSTTMGASTVKWTTLDPCSSLSESDSKLYNKIYFYEIEIHKHMIHLKNI